MKNTIGTKRVELVTRRVGLLTRMEATFNVMRKNSSEQATKEALVEMTATMVDVYEFLNEMDGQPVDSERMQQIESDVAEVIQFIKDGEVK